MSEICWKEENKMEHFNLIAAEFIYLGMDGIWVEFWMVLLLAYRGRLMILRRVMDWTNSIFDQLVFDMLEAYEGQAYVKMGYM